MRQYLGSQLDVDTQRLKHVGAAAGRGAGPAPLLGAGRGGEDGAAGGDVDAVGAVAAGADNVDGVVQTLDPDAVVAADISGRSRTQLTDDTRNKPLRRSRPSRGGARGRRRSAPRSPR